MNRTWRRITIAAMLLVVTAVLVPVVFVIRYGGGARGVAGELAKIKSEGAPTCAADLAGTPIPNDENATVVYQKCFDCLPKSGSSQNGDVLADFLDPEKRAADPQLWTQAGSVLSRCSRALSLAEKAAAMPTCRYPVEWSKGQDAMLAHLPRIRQLARLLAAQALVDARNGKTSKAARRIVLIYRVSDSLKGEPLFVSQMVRYACLRTASSTLSGLDGLDGIRERDARALAATIGRIELGDGLKQALMGERAEGITMFVDMHDSGKLPFASHVDDAPLLKRFYATAPGRVCLGNDEAYFLREMERRMADAATPYRRLSKRYQDTAPGMPRYAYFSAMMLPAYGPIVSRRDGAVASLAGSRIFLGLLAYHDHFHSYPTRLDGLKKLNWQLPKDPFSGKSFAYRRQGRGFILYSVGEDLKDNGGIESRNGKPGDIVWKLAK